jgi:hypothetical protein
LHGDVALVLGEYLAGITKLADIADIIDLLLDDVGIDTFAP